MALDSIQAYAQTSAETLIRVHEDVMRSLGKLKNNIDLAVVATAIAGVLTGSGSAYAQSVPGRIESPVSTSAPNPEYDRIIAEAQKAGKDPVKYARDLKRTDDFVLDLGDYISDRNKHIIVSIKEKGMRLDERNAGKEEKNAGKEKDLIKSTKVVIAAMKVLEKDGKFGTEQIVEVNKMYASPTLPKEVKDMIFQEFGRYIRKESLAQL